MRLTRILYLAAMTVLLTTAASADEPFSIRILEAAEEAPLGLHPTLLIEVRNETGTNQPMAFLRARVGVDILTSPKPGDGKLRNASGQTSGTRVFSSAHPTVSEGWVFHRRLWVPTPAVGQYIVRAYFQVEAGATTQAGEPNEHWVGTVHSETIAVRALEPAGVDADAFQSILAQVPPEIGNDYERFSKAPILVEDAKSQILRNFPKSTYAAYQIYLHHTGSKPWQGNSNLISGLETGIRPGSTSVPCDNSECAEHGFVSLNRIDYTRWKAKWFERVLKFHPEIWFADDIRFHLALTHYLLGEKAQSALELEALAKTEPSLWATKSKDLLRVLREKEMIESCADSR